MNILTFTNFVEKLKLIKRAGWVRNNIPNPESVAEHSFRTTVLAMVLAPQFNVNQLKVIKMALVHDLGEAKIGDITTKRGKTVLPNYPQKIAKEHKALKEILSNINGDEYLKLFEEFVENKTNEAKFVRQLDKLEMAIQAYEYEKEHNIKLEEFFDDAESVVDEPKLKEILAEIVKNRQGVDK